MRVSERTIRLAMLYARVFFERLFTVGELPPYAARLSAVTCLSLAAKFIEHDMNVPMLSTL